MKCALHRCACERALGHKLRSVAFCLPALVGCAPGPPALTLPPEILDSSTRALILVIEREDNRSGQMALTANAFERRAEDSDPPFAFRVDLAVDHSERVRVTALGYRDALASLDVPEGTLVPALDETEGARELPGHASAFEANVASDVISAWRPVTDLRVGLRAFRFHARSTSSLCERTILMTSHLSPFERDLLTVATVSNDLAFIGGGGPSFGPVLATVDGACRATPMSPPSTASRVTSLGWNRRRSVYGTADSGVLFEIDTVSRSVTATLSVQPGSRISSGGDGTTILYGGSEAYEVGDGLRLTERTGFPPRMIRMFVVSRDRMVALTADGIHAFDGSTWSEELGGRFFDEDSTIAGDQESLMVLGPLEILLRDEQSRTWAPIAPPFTELRMYAAASLGNGAYIAGGRSGAAALLAKGSWCRLETGTLREIRAIDPTADQDAAFAVTYNDGLGTQPACMTIAFPR